MSRRWPTAHGGFIPARRGFVPGTSSRRGFVPAHAGFVTFQNQARPVLHWFLALFPGAGDNSDGEMLPSLGSERATFSQLDLGFRTFVQAVDGQRFLGFAASDGPSYIIDGQSSTEIDYPNTYSTQAFAFDGMRAVGDLHYIDSTYSTYGGFYFDGTSVLPIDSINGYRVIPRGIVGSQIVGSFYSAELGRIVGFVAAVPEPSTYAMALAGLACGGFSMWRRRKRS